MIVIIDYDTGNLRSVANVLKRLNAEYELTADPVKIMAADRVLMPGVGQAADAMLKLQERGLTDIIPQLTSPVLGICIGMQLMCRRSDEGGGTEGLGIFDTTVKKLTASGDIKVPHMGWSQVSGLHSGLFESIREQEYFYFVHSFAPELCDDTIACSEHGVRFSAALNKNNFYGTQFHPEKSGSLGEKLIDNFLKL